MFKNMIVYRIAESWQGDLQQLEDALQKTVFEECGATQERSVGWVPPRGEAHGPLSLLLRWQAEGRLVPLCPEVFGGLPTPRPPAEIAGGQGARVLDGELAVLTVDGVDVSPAFLAGAREALRLCAEHGIRLAVLKARSPSCGVGQIYDGHFSGQLQAGDGLTALALRQAGVTLFTEADLAALAGFLATET